MADDARTIYDLLRYGIGARVSCGGRWLTVDEASGEYVVREQRHRARHPTELIRTTDEAAAVRALDPPDGDEG